MASNPSTSNISDQSDGPWIPRGYMQVNSPDNEQYILPEFMFLALQQECNAYMKRQDLGADQASGLVSTFFPFMVAVYLHAGLYGKFPALSTTFFIKFPNA